MAMDLSTSGRECDHEPYLPSLPDDVALECLLRVSPCAHNIIHNVSRKWRSLVNSTEFYDQRRKEGATRYYLCLLQAAPQTNPEDNPVYYISVVDTSSNKWERLPPVPELASLGLPLFCRVASAPGKLVVLGGWHPATRETLTSVYIFSFTSWTWRRGADMPTPRSFFATIARSHRIVVAGGHDNVTQAALATAEIYNTREDSWQSLPDMASPRDECIGVAASGFLVTGGYDTLSVSKFVSSGEMYNPERNAWTTIPDMCDASVRNAVATSQGVFAFRDRELVRFVEYSKWEVVDEVPEGISTVASAAGFGCGIGVTGPCRDDEERYRLFVYRLGDGRGRRGEWDSVRDDDDFAGVTLASCAVEC